MGGAIGGAPHLHLTAIRMTRPRLFVAVWPPEQVAAHLARLVGTDGTAVRRVPTPDLHVTIRFLGTVDDGAVLECLAATDLPVAQARLGPAVTLFGSEVVMVPVAGLDELVEWWLDVVARHRVRASTLGTYSQRVERITNTIYQRPAPSLTPERIAFVADVPCDVAEVEAGLATTAGYVRALGERPKATAAMAASMLDPVCRGAAGQRLVD